MSKVRIKDGDIDHRTGADEPLSVEDILLKAKQAGEELQFEKAIELYEECIFEHKCSQAFHELESMIRDDISGEDFTIIWFQITSLLERIFTEINVFNNNESGNEESLATLDVSFGMLARCFGLLHEKTGQEDHFEWKLRCMLEHDNEKCIRTMESFLAKGRTPTSEMLWMMFLAIFRNIARTGDATYLSLLQKNAEWSCTIRYDIFVLLYAFLLEKGRIWGRDFHRLIHLTNFYVSIQDVTRYFAVPVDSENDTVEGKVQRTAEIPTNLRKAANIYQKVIESDEFYSNRAMNRCGLLHMIYPGELFDVERAEKLLQRAIDQNNKDALCNLAVLQFRFHTDRAAAMELLQRAFSDDPFGENQSGQPSEAGEPCSRSSSIGGDTAQSVNSSAHGGSKRTESSRDLDLSPSCVTSDRSESSNCIFETVFVKGRELKVWYRSEISHHPHTTSMNNMAVLLEEEQTGHNGVEKALRLYQRAREIDGNPIALYNMAVLLITGPATYRDILKGNELLARLKSRVADIGHMRVLMTGVQQLERYQVEERVSEWTVEIEELDDSVGFVKHIEGNRDEELAYDE